MNKAILLVFGISLVLLGSCQMQPPAPEPPTIIAIGDSITMGIQDAGLVIDYQLKSYPYLLAQQMGAQNIFQQPLVSSPGIGVLPYKTPLQLSNGQIIYDTFDPLPTVDQLVQLIFPRLQNVYYREPYNNLGVNGARLQDLRDTTGSGFSNTHSFFNDPNYFFDIVLRNVTFWFVPNFGGKTVVQEAAMLNPDYILLWIGNNDVLGYVLGGGEDDNRILGSTTFEDEYRLVLQDLKASTKAHIVLVNLPQYLPFGYALDSVFDSGTAKLFNPKTLVPIDFDPPNKVYIDLDIEAENGGTVKHLLLTAAAAYISKGQGIPSGLTQDQRDALTALGLTVPATSLPLTKEMVLTDTEEQTALAAVTAFNQRIAKLASPSEFGLPLVDVNSWMKPGGSLPDSYFKFALVAQDDTMFSLDGIHPNNFGHALITNNFIDVMNSSFGLNIPKLNADSYKSQYKGKHIQMESLGALQRLNELYAPKKP